MQDVCVCVKEGFAVVPKFELSIPILGRSTTTTTIGVFSVFEKKLLRSKIKSYRGENQAPNLQVILLEYGFFATSDPA